MTVRIVAADEFAAVVGLPSQIAQVHAPTIQVLLNASIEDSAGRRRAFLRKGPEQQTAANFPCRVFHQWQTQTLSLRPELRNIAQILGIGGDLLEKERGLQRPAFFCRLLSHIVPNRSNPRPMRSLSVYFCREDRVVVGMIVRNRFSKL